MKKFKRCKKYSVKKFITMMFILFIPFLFLNIKPIVNNFEIVSLLLSDSNYFIKNNNNIIKHIIEYSINDLFTYNSYNVVNDASKIVFNKTDYPLIYIYNTHDTERYLDGILGVKEASLLLKEKLEELGISTYVEERKVSIYIDPSYSSFEQGYAITRKYASEIISTYPNLQMIIDLHRDAVSRDKSYIQINGVNYARVLFVQGIRYSHYEENLALVNKINDKIKAKYPGLSRDIMMKQRDIFNQDLSSNCFLLELGSNNNTWEEVSNTIDVLSKIIKEIIYEKQSL